MKQATLCGAYDCLLSEPGPTEGNQGSDSLLVAAAAVCCRVLLVVGVLACVVWSCRGVPYVFHRAR